MPGWKENSHQIGGEEESQRAYVGVVQEDEEEVGRKQYHRQGLQMPILLTFRRKTRSNYHTQRSVINAWKFHSIRTYRV
jgi:hypothetical protein